MALPASGTIKASEIQTEFGGSNPISISEYYAADTGVPASGAISWSDFHGTASGPPFTVSVTPTILTGAASSAVGGTVLVTTNTNATVTSSGAQSPVSFLWEFVSGHNGISANTPSSNSTGFSAGIPEPPPGGETTWTAIWRCKVTDNNSDVVYSANVSVALTASDFS